MVLGEARSPVCGSSIALSFALDQHGLVTEVGTQVTACAVGQAAASLFCTGACGLDGDAIARAGEAIGAWLGGAPQPQWPGLAVLEPAREHAGRHGAILLPWKAATAALCND